MGIIHVLDPQVANQIAAGEVIERPCSAVKEMLENALDAHATNITVEIENGGLDLIKISDDGDGMFKEDLSLAIERHATSKIDKFNDVYALNTFGFRGEALASLAVISRLKIRSGRDNTTPSNIMISSPNSPNEFTIGAPLKGTCIESKDLYYNVPARKKFVRSNNHENSLIYDLVCKFALAFPSKNFTYMNDKTTIFSSNQLNTVEELMKYIHKDNTSDDILHIKKTTFYQNHSIEAWFFHPSITRKNRNQMIYFVNDRLIESKELNHILDEAIYTLIPKGRFPICVIKLYLPAFNIDINVHPSKKIIKFKDIDDWKHTLIHLIKESLWISRLNVPISLKEQSSTSETILAKDTHEKYHPLKEQQINFGKIEQENIFSKSQILNEKKEFFNLFKENTASEVTYSGDKINHSIKYMENSDDKDDFLSTEVNETATNYTTSSSGEEHLSKNTLLDLQYIGQLNNTFILAQDKNNLYIIDQHTLHERILYERFMNEVENRNIIQQPILYPLEVHLTPIQEKVLIENILILNKLGFVFKNKSTCLYEITEIPSLLSIVKNLSQFIIDMIDELSDGIQHDSLATIHEEKIITSACKAAVKANYILNECDVKYLLGELSQLKNAHTCPHGRPIIMNISMNELYLYFKRGSY